MTLKTIITCHGFWVKVFVLYHWICSVVFITLFISLLLFFFGFPSNFLFLFLFCYHHHHHLLLPLPHVMNRNCEDLFEECPDLRVPEIMSVRWKHYFPLRKILPYMPEFSVNFPNLSVTYLRFYAVCYIFSIIEIYILFKEIQNPVFIPPQFYIWWVYYYRLPEMFT